MGKAAPSWLLGKYYIDLRDNPYEDEQSDEELIKLKYLQVSQKTSTHGPASFEFVKPDIEIGTLAPSKLIEFLLAMCFG